MMRSTLYFLTTQEVQRRLGHIHPVRIDPNRPGAAQDIAKRFAGKHMRAIAYNLRGVFQQVVENYLQVYAKKKLT